MNSVEYEISFRLEGFFSVLGWGGKQKHNPENPWKNFLPAPLPFPCKQI